ncbi:MAG: hypothetical protein ACT4PX_03250 [Actinomycetota bacterium]
MGARSTGGSLLVRVASAAVAGLWAVAGAACSDGDAGTDGTAPGNGSTSSSTLSFEQRDAAFRLTSAATGINLVASEVGLRSVRGQGGGYCRDTAPGELEPHRAALGAAADADVRRAAEVALASLAKAIEVCAGGGDGAAVQQAIDAYNADYERLSERIEAAGP